MEENQLYTARVHVVQAMEQGLPWHEAAKQAGLQISQSTDYRLRQRFALIVSVSQINRVRAALGVSNPPQWAKKTPLNGKLHWSKRTSRAAK